MYDKSVAQYINEMIKMITFEILLYIVIFKLGIIILVNFSKKIIIFINEKQTHSNDTIFNGSTSTLTQSGTVDKDCNDSSFFEAGCDSCGGDGGGD